jgi:uncharacterized protein (DUF433 family)
MSVVIQPEAPPLRVDETGAIRVGNTRVLFVLVVQAFQRGDTPEQIAEAYDTLDLEDVYGAIAYYLRHRPEVEQLIEEYNRSAAEIREKVEARQKDLPDIRSRLLARRKNPA